MIALLLTIVIYGLIFWLLWWGLGAIALPEPFAKVATVILVIAAIITLIGLLTGSVGTFPVVDRIL